MRTIKLLFLLLVAGILFFGCGGVVDPIDDVPTDLVINQFEDGKIELSWLYNNPTESDTISFYIARKIGDNIWDENGWGFNGNYGFNLPEETTSIIDHIPTNDTLSYAYKVRFWNHTTEKFSNYSETIAYLSENTDPTNLISEQISQEELLISWEDNCVGEDGYKVDRKFGSASWNKEYQILPESSTSFVDEVALYDTIYYRVYAYLGISETDTVEDSIFNSLAAPSDLEGNFLDVNKVRLNWTDNSTGEDGFYIDRKIGFLEWDNEYAAVDSNISTFMDDILLPCATLQYRLRAFQGLYTSNCSNIDTTNVHLNIVGSTFTPGDALDISIYDWTVLKRTAFVADNYLGLALIDCMNPSEPEYLVSYEIADRTLSVFIVDNIAYVAVHSGSNTSGQVIKVDIMDELAPILIGSVDTQGIPKDIFISGDFAYVAEGDNGLSIMYTASSVMSFESNYPLNDAREVYVLGRYAFVANGLNGLEIFDIIDAGNPVQISHLPTTGLCNDIHVQDNIAFVADGEDGLTIIDISDVSNPMVLSQIEMGGFAYGVFADGNYAYLIDIETGFYVVDVSNPVSPFVLGNLEMDTEPVSVHLAGSYVYITDNEGLKIVQIKP